MQQAFKNIKEEEGEKNPKKQTAAPSWAKQKGGKDALECANHLDFLFPKSYCPVSAADRGVKHQPVKSVLISTTKNAW